MPRPIVFTVILILLLLSTPVFSGPAREYAKPVEKDKCPVCGMFVAKYPDWVAEIVFSDGTYRVFDGAKDMFKYLADPRTYDPKRTLEDISVIYVTDYYTVHPVDARKAFFVIGSDVYGPMGAEFVPFEKESDATEFKKDHDGRRILKFSDVTPVVLKKFD
ncbi:MAG TPA: nitrous oxide reductase accessory protein NosL [Nitrospirota bacterium]|nr:nitrous oxide reductase accessory protein NosL [Nitrospirota bacterium]